MQNNNFYFTQFPEYDSNKTPTDIVIGLDFGTSCSKVVIRSPYSSGGRASAVHFGDNGHIGNKFLLPTRPFFDKNYMLKLGAPLSKPQFPALKMRLLDKPNENALGFESIGNGYTNINLAVGYLAEVLRISRKWFIENQASIYGNAQIRWYFNLGIPSTGHRDDNSSKLFCSIAKAAWCISVLPDYVSLSNCKKILLDVQNGVQPLEITSDRIQVIPEVSAQVVGYCKSSVRRNGLHLLIDVGAGTADICCFLLDIDKHTLLGSSVERLGAFELHSLRIAEMKERISKWMTTFGSEEDPIKPMPDSPNMYLPNVTDGNLLINFQKDEYFQNNISGEINKVLSYVRKQRDPNSPNWESGITTFLTGGGSQAKIYEAALNDSHHFWSTSGRVYGLRIIDLGTPSNLVPQNLSTSDYQRLSVAYGLSHTKDELGNIKPESEIKDLLISQRTNNIEDDMPGHDNSPG